MDKRTLYAVKGPNGYVAQQGRRFWIQDTPEGWAAVSTRKQAEQILRCYLAGELDIEAEELTIEEVTS